MDLFVVMSLHARHRIEHISCLLLIHRAVDPFHTFTVSQAGLWGILSLMVKKPVTAMLMHPIVRDELIRPDHAEALSALTRLVSREPFRDLESIAPYLNNVEVLITSWGCPRIDQAFIERAPQLRLIAHLAGSVKGFIDEVVWRRGVQVINAVSANAVPVAEYTLAAILFANKQIFTLNRLYVEHRDNHAPWSKEAPDAGNYGKTIGIIGASHVGRLVLQYLQPFDLQTILYDPYTTALQAHQLGARKVGLAELLTQAHVVSVHAPLLEETRGLLGQRELALMQNGTVLINTARGAIIDQAALETELQRGRIFAVLDTTNPEVLPADNILFDLPNVFLTPHIAGSLGAETERLTDHILQELDRYCRGLQMQHQVKREALPHLA